MSSPLDTRAALKHFTQADPIMAAILKAALRHPTPIALPTPKPPQEYFARVVRSIVSQQISVKAADAVFGRVTTLLPILVPEAVSAVSDEELRACGLSRQKISYIRRNAEIWHTLPIEHFASMDDEAVITELTKLYGIGRWTAEMFLMFSLVRPDVFSYGDLGLMQSLYQHYPVKVHHVRKIKNIVDTWSPHRTLASLALWWHKDGGPVIL